MESKIKEIRSMLTQVRNECVTAHMQGHVTNEILRRTEADILEKVLELLEKD